MGCSLILRLKGWMLLDLMTSGRQKSNNSLKCGRLVLVFAEVLKDLVR